jgi:hypothetical protein
MVKISAGILSHAILSEKCGIQVKMQLEFEGKFTVKALNPTTMATYGSLELQTDYTV